MTNTDNFLLGVNYWPRRQAMFMLSNFDPAGIREEFALIRDLGMKVVRIFLMWEDFQPTSTAVSETALRNLETVCDLAAEHNLWLDVTFFTGHMSGPNWSPGWLLDANVPPLEPNRLISGGKPVNNTGYRNYFTDDTALNAQRLLLETVVRRFKDHPGVWMWNLGNEPDLFALAPNREMGREWVREMADRIKSIDPAHLVTCGLHVASLLRPEPLR